MLRAKASQLGRRSAFTLVEILVVIAILAILAVVTFVVINPVQRINEANDNKRKEEVQSILGALSLYTVDNKGALPTAASAALPTVDAANIMTNGVAANTLDNISPKYLTTIPTDPSGSQYRVGKTASNALIVATTLSDSTTFVKSQ